MLSHGAGGCPSHDQVFQQLYHMKKATSVCAAMHKHSAYTGGSESSVRHWWRFQELLGTDAQFEGAADVQTATFSWLNESIPLQSFALRRDLFAFMTRHQLAPDNKALGMAKELNPAIYHVLQPLSDPEPASLGLGDAQPRQPTLNACRHTLLLLLLLHHIPKAERQAGVHVLEVGGGYGNMARMALLAGAATVSVPRWTVFDMRQSTLVQEWMLRMTLPRSLHARNVTVRSTREIGSADADAIERFFGSVAEPQVTLVDTNHFNSWASATLFAAPPAGPRTPLVAIGTHSWSELPWEAFCQYFNAIAGRAKYILYATQTAWPSRALVRRKLARFHALYDTLIEQPFGGNSLNIVFRLKSL